MATKNLSEYDITTVPDASNMIFGVVVAEWNPEITGALLDGCVSTLEKHGALPENIHVKTVPGSFELIYGAHQMTLNDGYDAVIVLGSVIRGETPHFDYICRVSLVLTQLATYLLSTDCSLPTICSRHKTVLVVVWAIRATSAQLLLSRWLNSNNLISQYYEKGNYSTLKFKLRLCYR